MEQKPDNITNKLTLSSRREVAQLILIKRGTARLSIYMITNLLSLRFYKYVIGSNKVDIQLMLALVFLYYITIKSNTDTKYTNLLEQLILGILYYGFN